MDPQINLDGTKFHKPCAKCGDCGCQITVSNFTKNESSDQTILLCKTHYFKRFHEGGSYLGGDKFKVKADRDIKGPSDAALKPVSSTPIKETVFTGVKADPTNSASSNAATSAELSKGTEVTQEVNPEPTQVVTTTDSTTEEVVDDAGNADATVDLNEPTAELTLQEIASDD